MTRRIGYMQCVYFSDKIVNDLTIKEASFRAHIGLYAKKRVKN